MRAHIFAHLSSRKYRRCCAQEASGDEVFRRVHPACTRASGCSAATPRQQGKESFSVCACCHSVAEAPLRGGAGAGGCVSSGAALFSGTWKRAVPLFRVCGTPHSFRTKRKNEHDRRPHRHAMRRRRSAAINKVIKPIKFPAQPDLIRAGQFLKIEVLDHIIIGNPNHSSLRSWVVFTPRPFQKRKVASRSMRMAALHLVPDRFSFAVFLSAFLHIFGFGNGDFDNHRLAVWNESTLTAGQSGEEGQFHALHRRLDSTQGVAANENLMRGEDQSKMLLLRFDFEFGKSEFGQTAATDSVQPRVRF